MLDALGPELLGRVLQALLPADLRAARLGARAFDEASRAHTDRASTLKLNADTAGGFLPSPDWARFPRLRRLALTSGMRSSAATLRGLLEPGAATAAASAAALARVEEVDADNANTDLWAAVLWHSPAVKRIRIYGQPSSRMQVVVLATIAALAPRLEELCAGELCIDARSAALLATNMPALRDLSLLGDDMTQAAWDALPCSRLTRLCFEFYPITVEMAEAVAWPRLRVLAGVGLTADGAEPLARGLPNLDRLEVYPHDPGWGSLPAGGAAFASVTWARFLWWGEDCDFGASRHALARLVPNIERLELNGIASDDDGDEDDTLEIWIDFSTLSRLVDMSCGWLQHMSDVFVAELQPAAWESLAKVTGLKTLALALDDEQLPRLARLPPSVDTLSLHLSTYEDSELAEEGKVDLGVVLEAAVRAPGVRALRLCVRAAELRHSRALARASEAAGRLRVLEVSHPPLRLRDITALAKLPGITRLAVAPAPGLSRDDARLQLLVAKHAAKGLQITLDAGFWDSIVTLSYGPF